MTIKFEVTRTKYYEKWLIYRRQIRQIFSCIFVLVVEQACIFADMLFQRVSDFPPMLSYVKWRYSFIITPSVADNLVLQIHVHQFESGADYVSLKLTKQNQTTKNKQTSRKNPPPKTMLRLECKSTQS